VNTKTRNENVIPPQQRQLRTLHLFAGAGGGILADILLGHRPIGAVEIEKYPRRVLLARQRDGILPKFPIWDDVSTFDGKPWRGQVNIVCGGFPCQDISSAGKGAGIEGERSGMWKHMARIIGEIRPRYAFVENSSLLVGRGLALVLGDLAEMGYDAKWGVLGAVDAGAPHRRDRIWIMADSNMHTDRTTFRGGVGEEEGQQEQIRQEQSSAWDATRTSDDERINTVLGLEQITKESQDLADSASEGLERVKWPQYEGDGTRLAHSGKKMADSDSQRFAQLHDATKSTNEEQSSRCNVEGRRETQWWTSEPNVGRVAHGVAARVDRLKAIGNGQVPAVAALAWKILSNQ